MALSSAAVQTRLARVLLAVSSPIGFSAVPAFADDWPGPWTRDFFSPSRNFKARVVPGDSKNLFHAPKGPYATAELSRGTGADLYTPVRTFTLLNPVAPVDLFLTDTGHLIAFDNWHNMGYGKVAVLYRPDGSVVRAYSLEDLFSAEDLARIAPSVFSKWWRMPLNGLTFSSEGEGPKLASGQRSICIATEIKGRNLEFDLETGGFAPRAEGQCTPLRYERK